MDPQPTTAPAVVAVVVTCDPGPWFEECLAALGEQDYPNLSVLVIDSGSLSDPTPRVARVLPTAYVRRLEQRQGFAAAANEALQVIEGAALYLICHDDVAPAPNAVRAMVEEAFRSNAGLVTGKLVDWEEPELLLQVGMGCDKFAAPVPIVERGELDQAQHDNVRDVAVVPGGCALVRADLFSALNGFDPVISLYGEDLDLSWRAQLAGARTMVVPAARIRHREAMTSGMRSDGGRTPTAVETRDQARRLQLRHRLRVVLGTYRPLTLLWLLPQLAVLQVFEVAYAVLAGRRATAGAIVGAWTWNLSHLRDLRQHRRTLVRREPDRSVRRNHIRGSARLTSFLRGQLAGEDRVRLLAGDSDGLASLRVPLLVWGFVIAVVLLGSRHLLSGPLALVGELAPIPGPSRLLGLFASGWRGSGLGSESPAPPAFALLGLAGAALGGATGLLQKIVVLGTIPAGIIGVHRLARPLGSTRGRLLALALYALNPLPYDALARGRWSGLLAYGAAPWFVAALARAGGLAPFSLAPSRRRLILGTGITLALLAALAPSLALVALVVALALLLGSAVAGGASEAWKGVVITAASIGIAAALLFPWSLEALLPGASWESFTGVAPDPARAPGLGQLVQFGLGPISGGVLGWALVVAAALPLLIGRDWRLGWAVRCWTVALVCVGVAWAAGRGWVPVPFTSPDAMLAPAAAAWSLSAALGLVAFEVDLPRYQFGWRQLASVMAGVAAVLAVLPVTMAAPEGRWKQPGTDLSSLLGFLPPGGDSGGYRVLWLGHPEALPLPGWRLSDGVAYATSRDGLPRGEDLWPASSSGATQLLSDSLRLARTGQTIRLGRLLAPMSVRYVVIARRAAPETERTPALPVPGDIDDSLRAQVDLKPIELDASLTAFENVAWAPNRARLTGSAARATRASGLASSSAADLSGAKPTLTERAGTFGFDGDVGEGTVLLGEAASPRWTLTVDGRRAEHLRAFGWANSFDVAASGRGHLRYRTSMFRYAAILIELAVWVVAVRLFRKTRP